MSKMPIIDGSGNYVTTNGSLSPKQSTHPAFKARVAIALPLGEWLYAPTSGHSLKPYLKQKATPDKVQEFQKSARLYLKPYGPTVTDVFIGRGALEIDFTIPDVTSTTG